MESVSYGKYYLVVSVAWFSNSQISIGRIGGIDLREREREKKKQRKQLTKYWQWWARKVCFSPIPEEIGNMKQEQRF